MSDVIGKQRTKEWNIDLRLAEIKSLKESIQSISRAESEIKAQVRRTDEIWRDTVSQQAMERALAAWRNQREQAYRARAATQTYSAWENSYRY